MGPAEVATGLFGDCDQGPLRFYYASDSHGHYIIIIMIVRERQEDGISHCCVFIFGAINPQIVG